MGTVWANKDGYLVNFESKDGRRTYAAADRRSLIHLVERLTGRAWDTFVEDERGCVQTKGLTIAYPLHIYGTV